jgi:hypothetical protein
VGMGRLIRCWAALAVAALVGLTACATGRDAVAGSGEFEFVSPGGQTKIFYDPPGTRGRIQNLGGDSLTEPGKQLIVIHDAGGSMMILRKPGTPSWDRPKAMISSPAPICNQVRMPTEICTAAPRAPSIAPSRVCETSLPARNPPTGARSSPS